MHWFKEKKWIWILECVTIFVFKTVLTSKFTQFTLSSSNARYSDNLVQHLNTSIIQCARLCNGEDECTSVNHNADTGVCELTTFVPGVVTPSTVAESNWNIYYDGTRPLNHYVMLYWLKFIDRHSFFYICQYTSNIQYNLSDSCKLYYNTGDPWPSDKCCQLRITLLSMLLVQIPSKTLDSFMWGNGRSVIQFGYQLVKMHRRDEVFFIQ
jgi:hypothetical protein